MVMSLLTIPFSTNAKYVQRRGFLEDTKPLPENVAGETVEPTGLALEQLAHPLSTERDSVLTD